MDQTLSLNPLLETNPTVTWLIVVKNGMPYIRETLESLKHQTYQNFQVLVWDNGSTDGTLNELTQWIPSRLPGKIFCDSPLSVGESRAALIRAANTELCAIIDADDICERDRLDWQVKFFLDNPTTAVLGSQMSRIDSLGHELTDSLYTVPLSHSEILYASLWRCPVAQPTVMLRRSAVLAAGNYRYCPEWQEVNAEDYDLWLRMLGCGFKFTNLAQPLVRYRVHDSSSTSRSSKEGKLGTITKLIKIQNAEITFGCSSLKLSQFLNQELKFSTLFILQIAQYLKQHNSINKNSLLNCYYLEAITRYIHPYDYLSRLLVVALQKDIKIILNEILEILKLLYFRCKIRLKCFS